MRARYCIELSTSVTYSFFRMMLWGTVRPASFEDGCWLYVEFWAEDQDI